LKAASLNQVEREGGKAKKGGNVDENQASWAPMTWGKKSALQLLSPRKGEETQAKYEGCVTQRDRFEGKCVGGRRERC